MDDGLTQKERDHNVGTIADMYEERSEFGREVELDQKIEGIERLVKPILLTYESAIVIPQVLLCHSVNKEAAWWVARQYGLSLVHTARLADNEFFVCMWANIETLLKSRENAKRKEFEKSSIIRL